MKKIAYILVLSILVLYILMYPGPAIAAASRGLVLWYGQMLPTLLPFAILSYIFIRSGILHTFALACHRLVSHLLPVSAAVIYPLAAGFLFGFPMGSKIASQLVEEGQMSYEEGNHLFSVCNNISPVFISGFILNASLGAPELAPVTLALLYLPPLLYLVLSARLPAPYGHWAIAAKRPAPRSQINFKIIDAGIMSGFETLTRLGGYLMLFAIFSQMAKSIPGLPPSLQCILAGLLEITTGIDAIAASALPFSVKYLAAVALTAFGGLSGLAQTAAMVKEAGFSMGSYLREKVICTLCTLALAWGFLRFFR